MNESEKTRKHRKPPTAIGDEQPLLRVLVFEATRRGETLAALAKHLGVTYERIAQWRRKESHISNAHRHVHESAARYLGWPTVLVLAMAGTVGINDFVWPGLGSLEVRVAQDLARLRQDPFLGGFVPAELAAASPAVKLFVAFMFRQLTTPAGNEKQSYQWIRALHLAAIGNTDAQAQLNEFRQTAVQQSRIF
jgi:hypothetical protein